ncbi:MAG: rhomboid family intramembrane serine protease [Plectolyngbya sp. WJT66-NPBG17]|jgi:membrane associated rhomboid family serine protease|nr:rhomboid family intramembrane serine protease [Plectolyngbya sp. WJT66-NPBG17]MBW4524478.1 rhomboid family intramembrane serine protease [Phormidium tanganyikae FI6-MK23]
MNDLSQTAVINWVSQARILGYLLLFAWIVSVLNFGIFGKWLNQFGIRPREWGGLWGVAFAPFLHGSWGHLEGNSIAFLTYGGLILLQNPENFGAVTVTVALTSGFGTWLLGRTRTIHIGASGVTFGYLGFLMFLAFFDRNIPSVLLLVFTAFFHSKYLWGLLPIYERVSWEEHLFGFVGGIFAARYLPQIRDAFAQSLVLIKQFEAWIR